MRQQKPPPRRGYKAQPRRNGTRTNGTRKRQQNRGRPVQVKNLDPNTKVRKQGNVYYMFHKTRRRVPLRLIVALIIVFFGAIGSAYTYAQIHSVQRETEVARQRLNNQRVANSNLESLITRNYTREEIEALASERLGMGPPDPSQIIYFHVPHQSGVMLSTYTPAPQPTENYFWQAIVSFFRNMRDRIFS